ncbi:hypothetical protein F0562_014592 [Nyssa sinensis]|uniref:Peptidase A1 domain-containing protein n=1 Tax=Nyssa sinensis TaxID=561372 RepID=A0A5J4ZRG9_9ASTE|nr:hypothetical protein F0562_014592 [Nyssa sinensis]
MRMSIGTPPFEILAIADTGSDLIWTQCEPCSSCYSQNPPLFDPTNSSTYTDISCNSTECLSLEQTSCQKSCQYSVQYGDQSFSNGDVATETITFGSNTGQLVSLPETIFGCGHDDGGTFSPKGSGIIGLGGGKVSLISQMGSSIGGKFSYCLVPFSSSSSKSSKMNFGDSGMVSGAGVVSTPIVVKSPNTFYYLTLEGISVGDERLDLYNSSSTSDDYETSSEGNIIIDSGTTLTLLPSDLYDQLESAVRNAIPLKTVEDPAQMLSLCYSTEKDFVVPIITAHFKGADVKLNSLNTFVKTSESVICLAFIPSSDLAIFGNLAQLNLLVGYDLKKKTLSFKPTNCAQHS